MAVLDFSDQGVAIDEALDFSDQGEPLPDFSNEGVPVDVPADPRAEKRAQLLTERARAQTTGKLIDVGVGAATVAEGVGQGLSQANPATYLPRLAFEVDRQLGFVPETQENPIDENRPLVSPQQLRDVTSLSLPRPGTTGEGVKQFAAEFVSGLTSPNMLAAIATGGARGVGLVTDNVRKLLGPAFAGDVISHAPEAYQDYLQALRGGDQAEIAKSALNLTTTVVIPAAIARHAMKSPKLADEIHPLREADLSQQAADTALESTLPLSAKAAGVSGRGTEPVPPGFTTDLGGPIEVAAKGVVKPSAETGALPKELLDPSYKPFDWKPIKWVGDLPVFSGKESRKALFSRFGIPNGIGRPDPKFPGGQSPFGAGMSLFVDENGKPIAIWDNALDVQSTAKIEPTYASEIKEPTAMAGSEPPRPPTQVAEGTPGQPEQVTGAREVTKETPGPKERAGEAVPKEELVRDVKPPSEMTFDELKDFLTAMAQTHEGIYKLETIYEQNVGEISPRNSGELVDFLAEHYDQYPQDLKTDFKIKPKAGPPEAPRQEAVVRDVEPALDPTEAKKQLKLEGVTDADADALLDGKKTVKEVVEGNFKITPTFNPKPGDADPRGGHAEAFIEGYNQAIERVGNVVEKAGIKVWPKPNANNVQDLITEYKTRQGAGVRDLIKSNPRGSEEGLGEYRKRLAELLPVTAQDLEFLNSVPIAIARLKTALGPHAEPSSPRGSVERFHEQKNLGIIESSTKWAQEEAARVESKLSSQKPPTQEAVVSDVGPAVEASDPRLLSDAELADSIKQLDESMAPFYKELEAIPESELFQPRTTKYTPAAQALQDKIEPFARRKELVAFEIERRAVQVRNKANIEARDKRVAEAPVYQQRNGWEIVKEGVDYVLRDPVTKEDVYRGRLKRVREVADESKPEPIKSPTEEPTPPAAAEAKIKEEVKNVAETEAPKSTVEESIPTAQESQSLGISPTAHPAIRAIANLFNPGAVGKAVSTVKDFFGGYAGRSMPKITRANRELGEHGVRWASSRIAAKPLADVFSTEVIGDSRIDPKKLGTALTEDNLRSVREGFTQAGDDAAAARVHTVIGSRGSPFQTEAAYQAFLADPNTQAAIARYKQLWDAQVEPMYKKAMFIDPNEVLPDRGLQTGARVNLMAVQQSNPNTVQGIGKGNLLGTLKKKSPFGIRAKGTGQSYNGNIRDMMRNTFGRQLEIANKNAFDTKLVETGDAVISKPGEQPILKGETTVAFPYVRQRVVLPQEGAPANVLSQNRSIYVRKSLAKEYSRASNTETKLTGGPVTQFITSTANRSALAGFTDATVHISNLATVLMTRPAVAGKWWQDAALSATGRADLIPIVGRAIAKVFQDNAKQLSELAEIGAARQDPPPSSKLNPMNYLADLIHVADRTTRLVMDDAFKRLVDEGLVENTETNRREWVNQTGQYNKRLQGKWTAAGRDSGLSPFITAGKNFTTLGVKNVTLNPGVKATGLASAAALRANVAAKWVGLGVLAGTLNYLLTKDKPGGGMMGRPGTPVGDVDSGQNDENGRPLVFPLASVIGLGRGLRVTGIRGYTEAKRKGLPSKVAMDAAVRDMVNSQASLIAGPPVRLAVAGASGYAPAINVGRASPVVPPGESQHLADIKGALIEANPVIASIHAAREPGGTIGAGVQKQFPRFTLAPKQPPEMLEKYPEIVRKAQANDYINDTIRRARKMKPEARMKFLNEAVKKLAPEDQRHAWEMFKRRRVLQ